MITAICVDLLPPPSECKYKWSPDTTAELAGGVRKVARLHVLFNGEEDSGQDLLEGDLTGLSTVLNTRTSLTSTVNANIYIEKQKN